MHAEAMKAQELAKAIPQTGDGVFYCGAGGRGMEARGFIFGAAVAIRLGGGFIPIRKPGKLPVATIGVDYDLEYGTDRLELDPSTMERGASVAIVDDLINGGRLDLLLDAIKAKTDTMVFTKTNELDVNTLSINGAEVVGDGNATPWDGA